MIKYNSRHCVIQTRWFDLPQFGAAEAAVALALDCFATKDGWCWPSQATLAKMLKKSPAWVIDKLNTLIELGIVEKQMRRDESGNLMTCLYRVKHDAIADDPGQPSEYPGQPANQSGQPAESNKTIEQDKPKKEARQCRLPENWEPKPSDVEWALIKCDTDYMRRETEKFRNYYLAKGTAFVDWSRAWMNWIVRSLENANRNRPSPTSAGKRPGFDRDESMQRIFAAAGHLHRKADD